MEYILLSIIFIGMLVFTVGAVVLNHEEKAYRYDISLTDEHEI